jgi:Cft2 family RNA processing exonuclease
MSLELLPLGGTVDSRGIKPSIGGSMYALLDRIRNEALVIDCGVYPSTHEDGGDPTELAPRIEKPEAPRRIVGGKEVPSLPPFHADMLSGDLEIDINAVTEQNFPNFELLSGFNIRVVITHAHADHVGALVVFKKQFPNAQIFMTKETLEIATWGWHDSFKIAQQDGRGRPFSSIDVKRIRKDVNIISPGMRIECGPFLVSFTNAGHILGAVGVHVIHRIHGGPSIFFTGDTSLVPQYSIGRAELPSEQTSILVSESTYGGQIQEARERVEERLALAVKESLLSGGKVLFPALSIGRPLEIYGILKKFGILNRWSVFIDGSARELAKIYRTFGNTSEEIEECFVTSNTERDIILRTGRPLVAIVPSGMLTGGFAVEYASSWGKDPRNLIAFSSYLDPCSPGYRLLKLSGDRKRVNLFGRRFPLRACVAQFGLSAHISHEEILSLIETLKPEKTFLVHGNESGMDALSQERGCVHKTFLNTSYELA